MLEPSFSMCNVGNSTHDAPPLTNVLGICCFCYWYLRMPNKRIHKLTPSDEVKFFPGVACNKLNCQRILESREAVVAHIKKDHVKRYKCRHCSRTTSRLGRTKQHQKQCPSNPEVMARQVEAELPSDLLVCSSWPAEDALSVTAGDDLLEDLCRDEGVSETAAVPVSDAISLPTVTQYFRDFIMNHYFIVMF